MRETTKVYPTYLFTKRKRSLIKIYIFYEKMKEHKISNNFKLLSCNFLIKDFSLVTVHVSFIEVEP